MQPLTAGLALMAMLVVACGQNDGSPTSTDGETAPPAQAPDTRQVPVMDPGSGYVTALCSIRFFDELEPPDLGDVIAQLRALPTTTEAEATEAAWLVERMEIVDALDDPLSTGDVLAIGSVLRARCSL
jgi:hypothetical protein